MNAEILLWITSGLVALPAALTAVNHLVFRRPRGAAGSAGEKAQVSVLIPARDEAMNIEAAVRAALASEGVEVEVVVLDDHSTDETAALVRGLAAEDPRVRLESAPDLPAGWCGKQHACARLAEHARHDLLLFVDADVKMEPEAVAGMVAFLEASASDLVSAFPRQVTATFLEKLMIPLIEFLLLGYLPLFMARRSGSPEFAAGCGQVFFARRGAYESSGGHGAIRSSLHDGIKLPRSFRKAGFRTDVCVGAGLFECRMYRSGREVWAGLLKNAHEGIASPALIVPFTILLFGSALVPWLLVAGLATGGVDEAHAGWVVAVAGLSFLPRLLNALRFRQSLVGVVLHPLSIALFLVLQWQAFVWQLAGRRPEWRGRQVG